MTDAEFIKSWRDKLVRPNRLDVFTEDMCESLDRLERITVMWEKLKEWAKERNAKLESLKVIGDFERVLEVMSELEKEPK